MVEGGGGGGPKVRINRILLPLWNKYQNITAPPLSPIASILSHPECQTASRCSDFPKREQDGLDKFYQLCSYAEVNFQYLQEKNFLNKQQQINMFDILMVSPSP